jgi:integrase
MRSGTIRTRSQGTLSLEMAKQRLESIIQEYWADSTLQQRRHLVERWLQFCRQHGIKATAESVVLWILAIPEISMQSQLQYSKAMAGTFKALGWDRQDITTLCAALRAQGAEVPLHQAYPISKLEVAQLLRLVKEPFLYLAIMIAWKSASRWGEVSLLTARHFLKISPTEVVIGWGTLPKGKRGQPFYPSMFTVIVGDWTPEIARLAKLLPKNELPFCPLETLQFDAWTRKLAPPLDKVTGHSFKHGAATHVIDTVVREKLSLDPRDLSLLLKHKLAADLISTSTLRYPALGVNLAKWLGTQRVTNLL